MVGNVWIGEAMSDEVVVLFTGALRDGVDPAEYGAVSQQMTEIVSDMPGFISKELAMTAGGTGYLIVRFESEAALDAWRTHPEHVKVMERGRNEFYATYSMKVCRVVRESSFTA
jgi:heme-degrading monooxygenase HmoA